MSDAEPAMTYRASSLRLLPRNRHQNGRHNTERAHDRRFHSSTRHSWPYDVLLCQTEASGRVAWRMSDGKLWASQRLQLHPSTVDETRELTTTETAGYEFEGTW